MFRLCLSCNKKTKQCRVNFHSRSLTLIQSPHVLTRRRSRLYLPVIVICRLFALDFTAR